jgi:hypothetical protein
MWPADAVAYFIHWVMRNWRGWWGSFLGLLGGVVSPFRVFTVGRGLGIGSTRNRGDGNGHVEAQRLRASSDVRDGGGRSVELVEMRGALPT